MHGGTLIGMKNGNPFPYAKLVDDLGKAARESLTRELMAGLPGGITLRVLEPSSYNQKTYQVGVRGYLAVPLKNGSPDEKQIPHSALKLVRGARPGVGYAIKQDAWVEVIGLDQDGD